MKTKTALDVFEEVFALQFAGGSWDAWRAFLAALFALPSTEAQGEIIRTCTGRSSLPTTQAREAWLVKGRRAGGSRMAAFLAAFLGCFRTYKLAPGETGAVMVLAADRRQARVIFKYAEALIDSVPMLKALVTARTKETLELSTGVTIEITTANFKTLRGRTVLAAICDEIAFWETDETSANPDTEILNALRPSMATIPGALLIALSSPYARKGELWRAYNQHFGQQDGDPILVWQASSLTMNPILDPKVVEDAYAEDEAAAAAEYGAEFRKDIESFIPKEVVEAVKIPGRLELPRESGVRYVAFCDPAGGSGGDSYTLSIAHVDQRNRVILDVIRETKPPFSPEAVTAEYASLTRGYGVTTVVGDRWGGEWPRESWRKHGVSYRVSDFTKSELYREALPLLTTQRVELLDHARLVKQLQNLERRTARGGRDSIDHPPRQHDDVANSSCGALVVAAMEKARGPGIAVIRASSQHATYSGRVSGTVAAMRAAKSEALRQQIENSQQRDPNAEPWTPAW